MKKQLLASLMLSSVLATSLHAVAETTPTVAHTPHAAASNNIPQKIAAKEATTTVEVKPIEQATWTTPQNILIGSGVIAAFLFPKVTFSLMAGYAAYSYFFGAKIEKTAEILTPVKTNAPAVENTEKKDKVVVPRLNFSSLTSPLDAADSHRYMEKAQTARATFGKAHIERQSIDDLRLVEVNLAPQGDVLVADTLTLPDTDLTVFAASTTRAQTARSESPASTTSTTAAVVAPAVKKTAVKGSVTPRKLVITPRGNRSSELRANTPRGKASDGAKPAAWR